MPHDRERRPRALFAELEVRISERTGRPWYSAWLGERPPGTIGQPRRLPADLPAPGEVLRLASRGQGLGTVNSTASRRERRLRDLGDKP